MQAFWYRLASWPVVSIVIGSVLLIAVALKGYEVATEELLEDSLLTSRWFLMLAVEFEVLLALWLVGGFYQFYPAITRCVAVVYFLILAEVALDAVVKGQPSCACFGKALVPPWVTGSFDVFALVLLVAAPLPHASRGTGQIYRWGGLAGSLAVFGILSLYTMWDYSTVSATPSMRRDPEIGRKITIQRLRPTTNDLLAVCQSAANSTLVADERLIKLELPYGPWNLENVQVWEVMESLARWQLVPVRWEKREAGYTMVPAAPYGKRLRFWFNGVGLLFLLMIALRSVKVPGAQNKLAASDTEASSVLQYFPCDERALEKHLEANR